MRGWIMSLIQWALGIEDSWGQEFVVEQINTIATVGEIVSGASDVAMQQLTPDSAVRLQAWLGQNTIPAQLIPMGVFRD